jgi:hypothetical protein
LIIFAVVLSCKVLQFLQPSFALCQCSALNVECVLVTFVDFEFMLNLLPQFLFIVHTGLVQHLENVAVETQNSETADTLLVQRDVLSVHQSWFQCWITNSGFIVCMWAYWCFHWWCLWHHDVPRAHVGVMMSGSDGDMDATTMEVRNERRMQRQQNLPLGMELKTVTFFELLFPLWLLLLRSMWWKVLCDDGMRRSTSNHLHV